MRVFLNLIVEADNLQLFARDVGIPCDTDEGEELRCRQFHVAQLLSEDALAQHIGWLNIAIVE